MTEKDDAPAGVTASVKTLQINFPLTGQETYAYWSFKMVLMLKANALWNSTFSCPLESDLVMHGIVSNASEPIAKLLMDQETAVGSWNLLKLKFAGESVVQQIQSLKSLVGFSFSSNPSQLQADLAALKEHGRSLTAACGSKCNESIKIANLITLVTLAALPTQYSAVRAVIENEADKCGTLIEFSALESKLLREQQSLGLRSDVKMDTAMFSAKSATPKCPHGRTVTQASPCWKCNPELRPVCTPCKAANVKFYHKEGSRFCLQLEKKSASPAVALTASSVVSRSRSYAQVAAGVPAPAALMATDKLPANTWILDSGATQHMTNDAQSVTALCHQSSSVCIADGSQMQAIGTGTVEFRHDGNTATLNSVLVCPQLSSNLLSVSKLADSGHLVSFSDSACIISKAGKKVLVANRTGSLYSLELKPSAPQTMLAATMSNWHQRLGHLNGKAIQMLADKGMATGIKITGDEGGQCVSCIVGKHKVSTSKQAGTRATKVGGLVHSDLCGPLQVPSVSGCRYFMTITDDYSRYISVFPLRAKSDAFHAFEGYCNRFFNLHQRHISAIRSDNGTEYRNRQFTEFCHLHGIHQQFTNVYSASQNGVSERINYTLLNPVRCMLSESKLPKSLWAEALSTAVYVRNRSPTSAVPGKTPYEVWTGSKPDLAHLRVFGQRAYAHVPAETRRKLDDRAVQTVFVGYDNQVKGYRLVHRNTLRLIISKDVTFIEEPLTASPEPSEPLPIALDFDFIEDNSHSVGVASEPDTDNEQFHDVEEGGAEELPHDLPPVGDDAVPLPEGPPLVPSKADRRCGVNVNNILPSSRRSQSRALTAASTDPVPASYKDIAERADAAQWYAACQEELSSLSAQGTWTLAPLPIGRKAIGCKWVFRLKYHTDGSIARYKARLVAKGFTQRAGIDYSETFAPVAKHNSLRILLSLASSLQLDIHQVDVKTAFLIPELEEEIYMAVPEGVPASSNAGSNNHVCRLLKTLYGLKQSPRIWNARVDSVFRANGFDPSQVDPCIYTLRAANTAAFIGLYVDDIIIAGSCATVSEVKAFLANAFDITDLGPIRFCLGFEIDRNLPERTLHMHQHAFVVDLLTSSNMLDSKPCKTPLDPSVILSASMCPESTADIRQMTSIPYRATVGSLLYLAVGTRPDIAAAVGVVCRYNSNPGPLHWEAVKHILRYLNGTRHHGILLGGSDTTCRGYADADWAGNPDTRNSTTGYVFMLGNAPVTWSSKLQKTVALSSCEAEYMALSAATQECVWIRSLLRDMGVSLTAPTIIKEDNQGCIELTKSTKHHARTKHIDIRYHFIRERIESRDIQITYCATADMVADIMTKALHAPQFLRLRHLLPVVSSCGSVGDELSSEKEI
jgi:hypothetical protein